MSSIFSHPDTGPAPEHDFTPEELAEAAADVDFLAALDDAPEGRDAGHDQAVPAAPPPPAQAPPKPIAAGTYAVYDDGAGGALLVLGQAGGPTIRKHIPAGMIRMAERFGGGGLAGLFGGS